jgi:hypothetical protein
MTILNERTRAKLDSVLSVSEERFDRLLELAGLDPRCDLRFSDLRGVDFAGSVLIGWDFTGSDLSGASFLGARIAHCVFTNAEGVDLEGVIELQIEAETDKQLPTDVARYRLRQAEEVLTELVWLNKTDVLPVPWVNRASLGLVTNSTCRIGVLKPVSTHAPPDIFVTPLRIDRLNQTVSVIVDLIDRPGFASDVLGQISNRLNVVMAETTSIDHRSKSRMTLVIESTDFDDKHGVAEFRRLLEEFKRRLAQLDGFLECSIRRIVDEQTNFERIDQAIVRYGTIDWRNVRDWFSQRYIEDFGERFDFTRAVVTSSSEGRYIRYVIPMRGVFQATISLLNIPTGVATLATLLRKLHLDIVFSRLSPSATAATSNKSTFVAICEPTQSPPSIAASQYTDAIITSIRDELDGADPRYQFVLESVSLGAEIESVAYRYRPAVNAYTKEITAQSELKGYLDRYDSKKKVIFFSYRDALRSTASGSALLNAIIEQVENCDCVAYDGFSRPFRHIEYYDAAEIRARMWVASACILFASDMDGSGNLSDNQLIEWGYFYGQGKPWITIARNDSEKQLQHWMVSDPALISYSDLSSPEKIRLIASKVRETIEGWFPAERSS